MLPLPLDHVIDLIICGLSFILYLVVLFTIYRDRHNQYMNSTYFRLCLVHAWADIVYYLFIHLMRARKFGYFDSAFLLLPKPLPKVFFIAAFHFKLTQLIGVALFSMNRYSVFKMGSSLEAVIQLGKLPYTDLSLLYTKLVQLWTDKGLRVISIIQWIFPVFIWIPGFTSNYDVSFLVLDDSPALRQVADPTLVVVSLFITVYYGIETLCNVVALVICTIFYGLSIGLVLRQSQMTEKANRKYNAELRLFIAAFITFAFLFLDTIFCLIGCLFQIMNNIPALRSLDGWWFNVNDALCVIQPWALLITSPMLRNRVLERISCGPQSPHGDAVKQPQSQKASTALSTFSTTPRDTPRNSAKNNAVIPVN